MLPRVVTPAGVVDVREVPLADVRPVELEAPLEPVVPEVPGARPVEGAPDACPAAACMTTVSSWTICVASVLMADSAACCAEETDAIAAAQVRSWSGVGVPPPPPPPTGGGLVGEAVVVGVLVAVPVGVLVGEPVGPPVAVGAGVPVVVGAVVPPTVGVAVELVGRE
ncbi:hypothetical protein GCM10009868_12540 [Terrabacter aerolatus]|uniref:Uncharacterized protein n=1 Tax=Terrabacter aerolatus TaxID=422442 RepID=A0A512CYL8_9MICO|nr:hypothetical protein TAE01_09200 [Terrabacter aerolatus]